MSTASSRRPSTPASPRDGAPRWTALVRLRRTVATGAIVLVVSAAQVGAPAATAALATPMATSGEPMVVLRQSTGSAAEQAPPPLDDERDPAGMASAVEVLQRQGAEGAEALRRLSAVEVVNPLPAPTVTNAADMERAPRVDATAPAATMAGAVMALAGEATGEAQATAATAAQATAAAPATTAARESVVTTATALAQATSAARATAEAHAAKAARLATSAARVLTMTARRQGASLEATRAAQASELAAATNSASRWAVIPNSVAMLPIALLPIAAVLCVLLLWRRQSEPFVLKAKPARA